MHRRPHPVPPGVDYRVDAPPARAGRPIAVDRLEPRRLLSSAFPNVDISRRDGNESEVAIAIDPTNPERLFAFSNTDVGDSGMVAARSSDGGATWTTDVIADTADDLPEACCDPSAAFDAFGNLFLSYINADQDRVEVLTSTDGGKTLTFLANFPGDVDQPTLTTGPGSVWVTYTAGEAVGVAGAAVTGKGQVGEFTPQQKLPGSAGGAFGDVAIGPDGQVAVTYQKPRRGRSMIGVNVDPDGLGPAKFGKRVTAATTAVGLFDTVPAQPERGVDAEAGLAYDRSTGPFRGRLYLVYNDTAPRSRHNLDVFVRYSDDGGGRWSNPIRVNDDLGLATQLLPRIAADDTTGDFAVSWLDTRDDLGVRGDESADEEVGTDVAVYAAVGTPTAAGVTLSPNARVSDGATNATLSENDIELGDYTALAFHAGTFYPGWADNSNAAGRNPDGARGELDVYTAGVEFTAMPAPSRLALGGLPGAAGPSASFVTKGFTAVTGGNRYTFKVTYTADAAGVDTARLDGTELRVTGPNGFNQPATRRKAKVSRDNKTVAASYQVINPAGPWVTADEGAYTIRLEAGRLADLAGAEAPAGVVGDFVVAVK